MMYRKLQLQLIYAVLYFQFLIDDLAEWLDQAGVVDACLQVVRDLRRELFTRITRAIIKLIVGFIANVHPVHPPQHHPCGHGVLNELGRDAALNILPHALRNRRRKMFLKCGDSWIFLICNILQSEQVL